MNTKKVIYVDNAATTKPSKRVLDAMLPFLQEGYGNPSSIYSIGAAAKKAVEKAREEIAFCLKISPKELFFTSGGTESDNWAIKGVTTSQSSKGKKHIISSKFEHHAVLHTLRYLEKQGFSVTFLDVYQNGIVKPEDLQKNIKEDTALVSIMYANNEIGTIQPIEQLATICKQRGVVFHTDAVQAIGSIPIDLQNSNIDLLSMSAHKLHGPKGVGALYIRKGIRLENLLHGGAQERGWRSGTENVAGIVGFAEAVKVAYENMQSRNNKIKTLRNRLLSEILKIDRVILNGDKEKRLPGNINVCFEGIEGEGLLLSLDLKGICASSGSACTSGSLDPSHVLLAIGLPHEIAHGSLRISLSDENTEEEIEYIIKVLPSIVQKLRNMSPVWERINNN